jgi:hypothetical protein
MNSDIISGRGEGNCAERRPLKALFFIDIGFKIDNIKRKIILLIRKVAV